MADDAQPVDQNDIEKLLKQAQSGGAADDSASSEQQPAEDSGPALNQDEIEALLSKGKSDEPASPADPSPAAPASDGDSDKLLKQDDIEALLQQAGKAPEKVPAQPAAPAAPQPVSSEEGQLAQQDLELLLQEAQSALASVDEHASEPMPPGVASFKLSEFGGAPPSTEGATLELVRDVDLDLRIELGRTHMYLEDVLKLRKGSVVALDKLAGDPVDVYVNERLIARGEVLVLNDNFCVRVAELIAGVNPFG